VEYGVKRSLTIETEFNYTYFILSNMNWSIEQSVEVRAIDDFTVEFKLDRPAGFFPIIAGYWVIIPQPREVIEKYGDKWTEPGNIWTNGPYVLTSWEHGKKIVLEKNPYYWDADKVSIKRINWLMIENESKEITMYEKGELDIAIVLKEDINRVRKDPKLSKQLQIRPLRICTSLLSFNTTKPPFDSPLVQKAFSAAIDRQKIVEDIHGGIGIPAHTFAPPVVFGFVDQETAKEEEIGISYDPDQARKWLAEAGYPNGKGFPETKLFSFSGYRSESLQAIRKMWKDILGVEVILVSWEEIYPKMSYTNILQKDPPKIWLQCLFAEYPDANSLLYRWFHSQSFENYTGWNNKKFDDIVEKAAKEVNFTKRKELYKKAEDILCDEDAAIAPICFNAEFIVLKPWIERTFAPFGIEHIERWKIKKF
jgi:oligopeptide transport system substrate-binding protein